MAYQLAWGFPGGFEWIVIAAIGLLLFGKRLPEVGRSLGKGIVEFKRGLKGIEEEVEHQSNQPARAPDRPALPSQYKFDPMTGEALSKDQAEQEAAISRDPQKPGYKFDPYTGQPIESQESELKH